ncbi:MAG: hypothetical protein V2A66_02705, partial [Pseudomonadota bacterium]
ARILVVDRSELAGNIYRLLLAPLGVTPLVCKRFEEARPHFFRREGVRLAIFNSNMFGKKFDDIVQRIVEEPPTRKAKKIFICREGEAEGEWRKKLAGLSGSHVVIRPFHPDEFAALVRKVAGIGGEVSDEER